MKRISRLSEKSSILVGCLCTNEPAKQQLNPKINFSLHAIKKVHLKRKRARKISPDPFPTIPDFFYIWIFQSVAAAISNTSIRKSPILSPLKFMIFVCGCFPLVQCIRTEFAWFFFTHYLPAQLTSTSSSSFVISIYKSSWTATATAIDHTLIRCYLACKKDTKKCFHLIFSTVHA